MYLYYYDREESEGQFDKVQETLENPLGILSNKNCCAEGIRDYFRMTLALMSTTGSETPDNYNNRALFRNHKKLASEMINLYRKSKCYQEQTALQRKKAEDFIKKDPLVEIPGVYIY